MTKDLDHGPSVLGAVILERLFQFLTPLRGYLWIEGFEKGGSGRTTVADGAISVGTGSWDRRQNRLDRPAALLVTMVPVIARHRQQVDHALCDRHQPISEVRTVIGQPRNTGPLKTCIEGNYGTGLGDVGNELLDAGAAWIVAAKTEKLAMVDRTGAIFDVKGELEGHLFPRLGAEPTRHRESDCLEIEIGTGESPATDSALCSGHVMIWESRDGCFVDLRVDGVGEATLTSHLISPAEHQSPL